MKFKEIIIDVERNEHNLLIEALELKLLTLNELDNYKEIRKVKVLINEVKKQTSEA